MRLLAPSADRERERLEAEQIRLDKERMRDKARRLREIRGACGELTIAAALSSAPAAQNGPAP
ncbi:hypothetical protein [Nonomuraea sp. NPDC049480]|uniref:hypothetical protein n=1 Tax=Nonomuraea sp. NPDC049480 TaxID=3364353 RepID=UPI0037B3C3E6